MENVKIAENQMSNMAPPFETCGSTPRSMASAKKCLTLTSKYIDSLISVGLEVQRRTRIS